MDAEEAKADAEKAKERYTKAGGEEESAEYKALQATEEEVENTLAADPQETEAIKEATKALKEAVKVLEEASKAKELDNAKVAAEKAKEVAEKAKERYTNAGGKEEAAEYKAVQAAEEEVERTFAADPQETEEIKIATGSLKEAVKALEEASELKELENAKAVAKADAEKAKEAAEKAKERYTKAGGEEESAEYKAVKATEEEVEKTLATDPQETEEIKEVTKALKEAVKALEEASETKELDNAKAVAEEAKEAAERAKERYTKAGGVEESAEYKAVQATKEEVEKTLATDPQETEEIKEVTKALKEAVKALEEASETKELDNAKAVAEEAKEAAERAKERYTKAGGVEESAEYKAVQATKEEVEKTLIAEPQETRKIENAIMELDKAVHLLEQMSTVNELENEIVHMNSMEQAINIKKFIEDSNLSDSVKSQLYSMIMDQMIDSNNEFIFTDANQVLQVIDTIEKSDTSESNKQLAYTVLTEKAIDDVSKGDKPTNELRFQQSENQAIVVGIEKVTDLQEKQKLTTLLELTIDIRSLTMQTAFTFAENDTWESITLPFITLADGDYGSTITWESSKETVIEILGNDATVKRKVKDESVILTARASNGNESIEKTFLLVVKSQLFGDKVLEEAKREVTIETGTKLTKPPVIQRINLLDNTNSSVVNKIDKLIIDDTIISEETNKPVIIYLPDDKENLADELAVEISLNVLEKLQDSLTIKTDQGSIVLTKETLEKMKQDGKDLFFRIVPVRKLDERNEVIERTRTHELVIAELQTEQKVKVLGTPREIETNYKGYETTVILPLDDVEYSNIENLRIFIEHTDGDRKVLSGTLVLDENDNPIGLQFTINKFSTFTIFEIVSNEGSETPGEGTTPGDGSETPGEGTAPEDGSETPGKGWTPVVENDISDNKEELSEEENLEQEQNKVDKDSKDLPKTASSNYNMILLGFAFMIISVLVLMALSRRKKKMIE